MAVVYSELNVFPEKAFMFHFAFCRLAFQTSVESRRQILHTAQTVFHLKDCLPNFLTWCVSRQGLQAQYEEKKEHPILQNCPRLFIKKEMTFFLFFYSFVFVSVTSNHPPTWWWPLLSYTILYYAILSFLKAIFCGALRVKSESRWLNPQIKMLKGLRIRYSSSWMSIGKCGTHTHKISY